MTRNRPADAAGLAEQLERAVEEFIETVEGLSDEQWRTMFPNEERSVGVLTRHVAAAIPFELSVFREIAAGRQPSTITEAQLAEMNALDAENWAGCPKDETLALLRTNAVAAADEVRQLRDEQLGRTGKYIEDIPEPWTVEQLVDRLLIGHVYEHLHSIRAVLASRIMP